MQNPTNTSTTAVVHRVRTFSLFVKGKTEKGLRVKLVLCSHFCFQSSTCTFLLHLYNLNFSLDRILLAGLWTLYMAVAWNVDQSDYEYQCRQLRKKHSKLMYY